MGWKSITTYIDICNKYCLYFVVLCINRISFTEIHLAEIIYYYIHDIRVSAVYSTTYYVLHSNKKKIGILTLDLCPYLVLLTLRCLVSSFTFSCERLRSVACTTCFKCCFVFFSFLHCNLVGNERIHLKM